MQYEDGTRDAGIELDCAACGHAGISLDGDDGAVCPNCGESYSIVVRDGFALLEAGGWAARITFEVPDGLNRGLAN